MGNKLLKITFSVTLIILVIIGIRYFITIPQNVKNKVSEIRSSFDGVILKEFKVRNTDKPTHLKIKIENGNKFIIISPNQAVIDYASVGDSIFKPKDENIIFIKKLNREKKKFFYTKLSYRTRFHRNFPKNWRKKWLHSSEWDK